MASIKTFLVFFSLALNTALAFAQHENLMEQAHGIPRDQMLLLLLKNNGFDENTPPDTLQQVIAYYYEHEADLLYEYDVERHKRLTARISQERAEKQAQWGQALTGILSGVSQAVDIAQQQAKIDREAARQEQEERKRQQQIQLQAQAAAIQSMTSSTVDPSVYTTTAASNNTRNGSIQDLYTSDASWNKALDLMVQQNGVERTRRMVQEMRAQEMQERIDATQQSYALQQQSANNQTAAIREAEKLITNSSNGISSSNGITTTAITTNRTQLYILIDGVQEVVLGYARGKDSLGRLNWTYLKAPIMDIKYTPYQVQFGKEYSRAANIGGVGYVFFN